jgi:hypothetical protein
MILATVTMGDENITLPTISRTVLNPLPRATGSIKSIIQKNAGYQVISSTRIDTHYQDKSVAGEESKNYDWKIPKEKGFEDMPVDSKAGLP